MKNVSAQFHPTQGNQEGKEDDKEGKEEEEEEEEDREEENRARCEWDFNLSTSVSSSVAGAISDTLGVIEFDPSDRILATGGIARKIRIYSLNSLLPNHTTTHEFHTTTFLDHTSACDYYICTPAKLSSLRWRKDAGSRVVGSGDYDGVVTEYDLERLTAVFERDEHNGRRVWSVDYSHQFPQIGASASDDGTAQLWDTRCGGGPSVAVVRPSSTSSPVCCVEFDPFGGPLVAMGSADRRAYVYDVRRISGPVSIFCSHRKTVTYVKFLSQHLLVSAAIDGCLKLWDMSNAVTIRTYKGHLNSRSFVGLSLWRNGGLYGCGSENNEVFVYDKRWASPIWVRGLDPTVHAHEDHRFVSSVCWSQTREDECILVAGGSDGLLQVFLGRKKTIPI